MSEITFELVTADYDKREDVKRLYEEAFPENERAVHLDGFIHSNKSAKASEKIFVVAALESDNVVGMIVLLEKKEYVFVFFLAVDDRYRGKGYGNRIMKTLFERYPDRTILFDIEAPVSEAPNYEQRIKRQAFFEGLGCINTGVSFRYGEDQFTLYCDRMSDKVKEYFTDYLDTCSGLLSNGRLEIPFDKGKVDTIIKML